MKLDYNKKEFTPEELQILERETYVTRTKYPDKVPILVQIDSKVITIQKNKFLVSQDITLNNYIENVLEKKIMNKVLGDTFTISIKQNKLITNFDGNKKLSDIYAQYLDPKTGMLIIVVSRNTTYKWLRSFVY